MAIETLVETQKDTLEQAKSDAQQVATELTSPSVTPEAPIIVEEVPERYRGKSAKDLIEMHENATRKISELGTKVHELENKDVRPFFMEPTPAPAQVAVEEDLDPQGREVQSLKVQNRQLALTMSVLLARSDSRMPDWTKYEGEVLGLVKTKPILALDPDWTKTAYDLIVARKLPEKISEAEERGKNQVMKKEVKQVEATVVDSGRNAPIPQVKESTPEDRKALFLKGKLSAQEYIMSTLSDAELKK